MRGGRRSARGLRGARPRRVHNEGVLMSWKLAIPVFVISAAIGVALAYVQLKRIDRVPAQWTLLRKVDDFIVGCLNWWRNR